MIPSVLSDKSPVYYSLQNPSVYINNFKGNKNNSTFQELIKLSKIIHVYKNEFTKPDLPTPIKKACLDYDFISFHHKAKELETNDNNIFIHPSESIENIDERFSFSFNKTLHFSSDAKFFRGCVQLISK